MINYRPKSAMGLLAVAAGLGLFCFSNAVAQTALDTQVLDETGIVASTGTIELISAGGQSIIGNVAAGTTTLALGYINTLSSDIQPPRTAIVIGDPKAAGFTPVLVGGKTPFRFAAVDDLLVVGDGLGLGAVNTQFAIDGGPFGVFTASFSIASDGLHAVSWFSTDSAGNVEIVKSTTVEVDATPPQAALLSPFPAQSGIGQVFKGIIPVLGTVWDPHLSGYRLESALGAGAASGFVLISSGTAAVSSETLGLWDATALSGFQILRLTAADAVQNAAVVSANVFIGDPALLLVLGGKKAFDNPEGVAVGSTGNIYVADTNNDRIQLFTSTGGFVASFGRKDEGHESDSDKGSLNFNKPKDVKVDAAGNIFVADTGNDRVVKLSPDGRTLLVIGKTRDDDGGLPQVPGALNKPRGVALDGQGNIYVADTNNRRVAAFGPSGAFLSAFSLPAVPSGLRARDGDAPEGGDDVRLGMPVGIAVDGAGNVYAADGAGGRALKFSTTGALLLSVGPLKAPQGIAVTAGGERFYVSDSGNNRIQGFDFKGNATLVFGKEGDDDGAPSAAGIFFNKPAGLALDASGNLYAADGDGNRVQKFGAPAPAATAAVAAPAKLKKAVVTAKGGRVERDDHAGVAIPEGALTRDVEISVAPEKAGSADEEARKSERLKAKNLAAAAEGVEYGPEGIAFEKAVVVTLAYDPDSLPEGIREENLKVHYWNRAALDWESLPSSVNKASHTVAAVTAHFSLYRILGSVSQLRLEAAPANPAFGFVDLYAFPNPSRRGAPVTIRLQVGVADGVDIRIYDVSGKLVQDGSFGPPQVVDDGNGKGPQYTYDYQWDVGGVGSGVYRYAVTAKKAGSNAILKTGRVGVVR